MEKLINLLIFHVNEQRFALPIRVVNRVVQVVELRKLPKMPNYLDGIINFHGEVIPVINIRALFGFSSKEIELSDQLIIAYTSTQKIALLVDSTAEVVELDEAEIVKPDKVMYEKRYINGVIKLKDGMVLINDIDEFLSPKELKQLEELLSQQNVKSQTPNKKTRTRKPRTKK